MELRMPAADDLHIHLRRDGRSAAAIEAVRHGGSARVLAMPNTMPPVRNGKDATDYVFWLKSQGADFPILTTVKLTAETTAEDIEDAVSAGVTAVKQYPMGVTTNSADGVTDVRALYSIYDLMQSHDLVLSLHGEVPGVFVLDAETAFLKTLRDIHHQFPRLRIVLEHITSAAAVEVVSALPEQVAATITDHHLAITLDDVVGTRIQPHHFCMPVAKRPQDRAALVEIVRRGHSSFFSGTDSAPHLPKDKEAACGCAGIFNAPYHMQFLATWFQELEMLPRLTDFTSRFGQEFYRLDPTGEEIFLAKRSFRVPKNFGGMVPFQAGKVLHFALAGQHEAEL